MQAEEKARMATHPAETPASYHLDDPYHDYQIKVLFNELKHMQAIHDSPFWRFCSLPSVQFIARHIQQFYWTATRLCGFGYLHEDKFKHGSIKRPALSQKPGVMKDSPHIYIDVTPTARHDIKTGIQRVVREVAKAAVLSGDGLPVVIQNGKLVSYYRHAELPDEIRIEKGDHLLLLDGAWNILDEYIPILETFARSGGHVIGCIYDLIPLLYPGTVAVGTTERCVDWLTRALPHCSAVVTISESVAEDLIVYLRNNDFSYKPSLKVGSFPLGADIKQQSSTQPSDYVQRLSCGSPYFITVGTLEARKNHQVALDAFDLLWKSDIDVRYIIAGKTGWLADTTRDRIMRHTEFGKRLIWLDRANDADLAHLYQNAKALIQPSIAEGFGLPIIESAYYGTPVIASDIRIFREVGGEQISYFDPIRPRELVSRIYDVLCHRATQPSIPFISWADATASLLKLIRDETYLYRVNNEANRSKAAE